MTTPALAKSTIRGTTWFSTDGIRELVRRGRAWTFVLAIVGVVVGLGTFAVFLVGVYAGFAAVGASAGHPELALFYALLLSWVFLFVTGIPVALSLLAYARDIQLLRTLPVRPGQIVAAKALLLYLYSLPTAAFFLIPAIVITAGHTGVTAAFLAASAVHVLVSPVLPVSLAVLAVLGLMRVVDLSRFRTAIEVAGMAVALVLIVGLQTFLSRLSVGAMAGGSLESLRQFPDLYGALARALPPLGWAAGSFVAAGGWWRLGASVGLTVAGAAAALAAAPLGFLRDPGERAGTRVRRRLPSESSAAVLGRAGSARRSLVRREWSMITSNSTYIFEAVGELVILPLVLGVYGLLLPREIFNQALAFVTANPALAPAILAVLVLMTNLTTVSATSISREGRLFSLSLVLPVAGRDQVLAKLLFHLSLFGPAFLLDCGIVLAVFRLPPLVLAYYLPVGFAFMLFGFASGMYFELKRPLLKWTHPQQAMKQNMNMVAAMGGVAVLLALIGAPAALLLLRGTSQYLVGAGITLAVAVVDALVLPRLLAYADRQYGGGLEMTG